MTTPSEDLESLRFLIKTHRNEFERRRAYEWRCVLMVFTFFVVVAGMRLHSQTSSQMQVMPEWIIWMALLFVWAAGSLFLGYVHTANSYNMSIAHRAEEAIQKCMNEDKYKPLDLYAAKPSLAIWKNNFFFECGGVWLWVFQSVFGFIFAIGAALIATS